MAQDERPEGDGAYRDVDAVGPQYQPSEAPQDDGQQREGDELAVVSLDEGLAQTIRSVGVNDSSQQRRMGSHEVSCQRVGSQSAYQEAGRHQQFESVLEACSQGVKCLDQIVGKGRSEIEEGRPIAEGQVWRPSRIEDSIAPALIQIHDSVEVRQSIGGVGKPGIDQQGQDGESGQQSGHDPSEVELVESGSYSSTVAHIFHLFLST